jgi:hypothetical protein
MNTSFLGSRPQYNFDESQQYIWQSLHATHREKLLETKEESAPEEDLRQSLSFSRLSDSFLGSASGGGLSNSVVRIRSLRRSTFF